LGLADSWDSVTELDRNNTSREARGSKEFYRAYTHFLGGSLAPKEKQQQPGRETFTGTKMSPRSTATEEQHDDDWATYAVARSSSLESSRHLVEQFVRHTTHDEPVHTTRRRSISKCQNSMLMMTHPLVLDVPQHEDLLTTCQSSFPPSTVRVSMDSLRQVPECVPSPLLPHWGMKSRIASAKRRSVFRDEEEHCCLLAALFSVVPSPVHPRSSGLLCASPSWRVRHLAPR
jgi:hypothetical protein